MRVLLNTSITIPKLEYSKRYNVSTPIEPANQGTKPNFSVIPSNSII